MANKYIKGNIKNYSQLNFLAEFLDDHNGYIAGGCFKNIFSKTRIKDIDIFFKASTDFDDAVKVFSEKTEQYSKDYENDNVVAFRHIKSGILLELCRSTFGEVEQVLNRFDFTVTKFALCQEPQEDGTKLCVRYHEQFFEHLFLKRLVIDNGIPFPQSTFNRMLRYVRYGYNPCTESKMKILKAIKEDDREVFPIPAGLYEGWD